MKEKEIDVIKTRGDFYMHGWEKGFHNGSLNQRNLIIKLAQNRICFDHETGCDHGACHALADLIRVIKEVQD